MNAVKCLFLCVITIVIARTVYSNGTTKVDGVTRKIWEDWHYR